MPLDFVTSFFTGDNQTGLSRFVAGGRNHRSDGDDGVDLLGAGMWHHIESFSMATSPTADANFILFKNDDFSGPFAQAVAGKGSGQSLWDCAGTVGSVMGVASNRSGDRETRLSARQQLEGPWTSFLDQKLAGSQASRVGGPLITWEAFPRGISYLDPALVYLKINQALHISIDWWPDYSASMTYHLLPFVNGAGHVRVWGARWTYWVESGAKSGKIGDKLKPKVKAGLGELETQVNNKLAAFDGLGTVRDVYLLPGNQLSSPPSLSGIIGNTGDDVTVVIVR